jgi:hypothetical protein
MILTLHNNLNYDEIVLIIIIINFKKINNFKRYKNNKKTRIVLSKQINKKHFFLIIFN